VNANVGSNRRM